MENRTALTFDESTETFREYDEVFFNLDDELDILKQIFSEMKDFSKQSDNENLRYTINAGIRQLYKIKGIVAEQLEMFVD